MSLVGNLEDLGLGEILQIVSLSRKSGTLSLQSKGRQGMIFFRSGQVVRATATTKRNFLGEVLIRRGVVDGATLHDALRIQHEEGFKERIGVLLVHRYQISAEKIDAVVREQIENVVYSFFTWQDGTFEFELQESVEAVDDTRLDPLQFMLEQGLNPQFLAMEGTRILDEKRHRGESLADELSEENAQGVLDLAGELTPPPTEPLTAPAVMPRGPLVLVDDDPETRAFAAEVLVALGFEVDAFAGSEDALIRIDALQREEHCPRLVVDLIMPRMDGTGILGGLELLDLVHSNYPELPVLVLSDYHNSEAERRLHDMGYDFLLKPRRSELPDPQVAEVFRCRLQEVMGRPPGFYQTVRRSEELNLGDELRLELGEVAESSAESAIPSTGISLLRGMLEELNDPALGGGIILLVLRFASEFMNRAVIFTVKEQEIIGLGQFGINFRAGMTDSNILSLRIPREEESLFRTVLTTLQPHKVAPVHGQWNDHLLSRLGGVPSEVFLGPLVSEGAVVAILYGDNLPEDTPIGDTESLEIFLSQAGLAMEKALLQSRLKGV